jgi:hypothetical protein
MADLRNGGGFVVRDCARLDCEVCTVYDYIFSVCSVDFLHARQSLSAEYLVTSGNP